MSQEVLNIFPSLLFVFFLCTEKISIKVYVRHFTFDAAVKNTIITGAEPRGLMPHFCDSLYCSFLAGSRQGFFFEFTLPTYFQVNTICIS